MENGPCVHALISTVVSLILFVLIVHELVLTLQEAFDVEENTCHSSLFPNYKLTSNISRPSRV